MLPIGRTFQSRVMPRSDAGMQPCGHSRPGKKLLHNARRRKPRLRESTDARRLRPCKSGKSMMRITSLMLAAAVVCVALPANGGSYPDKSVQIIADSAAGSTPDVALRFFAEELTARWGQQVIVINKPGAGGSLGARAAAEAVA